MGTGRKPHLSVVADDARGRRGKAEIEARAAAEPKGCTARLTPPRELSDLAKKEWRRVVKLYRQLDQDVINDLDVATLTLYCEARAIYTDAQCHCGGASTSLNSKGEIVESPYWRAMVSAGEVIRKTSEQLCLSPVGRARMGMAAAKKAVQDDPIAAFLQRRG